MNPFENKALESSISKLDAYAKNNPANAEALAGHPDDDGNLLSLEALARAKHQGRPKTRPKRSRKTIAAATRKPASSSHISKTAGESGEKQPENPIFMGETASPNGTPIPYFVLAEKPSEAFPKPGVYYVGTRIERGGEDIKHSLPRWICSPLRVVATTRNDRQGEWGRLLEFRDLDGKEHRWVMPIELLSGNADQVRATLMREGALITPQRTLRQHLESFLLTQRPDIDALCVNRTGWHGDGAFVLPHKTFGDSEKRPVLFQSEDPSIETISQAGDLDTWRQTVCVPCIGNTRLVFALAMAFAAPCLGLVHAESGGVHFRGTSSVGKSVALRLACSVYGRPSEYRHEWRGTDNGIEGQAMMHSDLLFVLDEMGQMDPEPLSKAAYMLANGRGKQRGTKSGGSRPVKTWRVLFASAGEIRLGDKVAQSGGRIHAGQEVRVIDVPADAGAGMGIFETIPEDMTPKDFAETMERLAEKQYGTAFPEFLRSLTAAPDKYRDILLKQIADIGTRIIPADATRQVGRVANRFVLIAAAGELATSLGITGWPAGEAERAAATCFTAWLDARGTRGDAEPAAMLEQMKLFLQQHGDARFTAWDADAHGPRTVNRAGYRKDSCDGPTYYIDPTVFKKDICHGFDPRAMARTLADVGALKRGGDGRLTRKEGLPDGRNTRVYVITPKLWEE